MNRRQILKTALLAPLLGLFKKARKKEPQIIETVFLNEEGVVVCSMPCSCNVGFSDRRKTQKITKWDDGWATIEQFDSSCTYGEPVRGNEEE